MTKNLKLLGAAAFVAGGLGLASAASAAPAGPGSAAGLAGSDIVEHVAQGCGPGFFRGPAGFCRPMGGGFGSASAALPKHDRRLGTDGPCKSTPRARFAGEHWPAPPHRGDSRTSGR